jgi:hypothetical protein
MVSHLFFSPWGLVALVWLCLMLHWAWPSDHAAVCPPAPEPPPPICARISHNSRANTSLGSNWLPFLLGCTAAIEHVDRLWGQLL